MWTRRRLALRDGRAVYRNRSGAVTPGCVPGSAQGLRTLTLRPSRKPYRFAAVVDSIPAGALGAVTATLVPGTSPVLGQAGLCSTLDARCVRRGTVIRCR